MTIIIGLTGGIACGKTTVTDIFRKLGVPVIDADEISRELTAPGGAALPDIAVAFGRDMIDANGLKRDLMREIIFSDPAAREKLESILHPMIKRRIFDELKLIKAPYIVLSVPLLLETGRWAEACKRVLVVDVSEDEQINRLVYDRHLGEEQARAIMAAQISRDKRMASADDLIDNSGSIEELEEKVKGLHAFYMRMAENQA
ncbi:MAG: dephospho-CoA kinase [Duodenibacillus sp.]|nr:dephospho-CoA kinase [Duodenibacillus sp.]